MSKLLLLLFKKSKQECTLLKSNVSDLLFFTQFFFLFFICFWQFFTTFPLFYAPIALYKRETVTLYRRAMWAMHSFLWAIAFLRFRSPKTGNLLEKPMSKFPTLVLEPKSNQIKEIWHFPSCTQGKQHANA